MYILLKNVNFLATVTDSLSLHKKLSVFLHSLHYENPHVSWALSGPFPLVHIEKLIYYKTDSCFIVLYLSEKSSEQYY